MLTADRMAQVDRNAAALGVPRGKLMESSGNALAQVIRGRTEPGASVTLVCGRGNNGGDGFAAARFLPAREPHVVLAGRPATVRTEIARDNWDTLVAADVPHTVCRDTAGLSADRFAEADLLVDALLGTGVSGSLREPERTLVGRLNDADTPVVSCDVPSGLDADTGEPTGQRAVDAEAVVTFHDETPGLAEVGELYVADIGIPAAAERFVGPGDLRPLSRAATAHKGAHGEVLVIGGGPYTGAPALAGQAAARAGADLVRLAVPSSVAREVQAFDEGLILRPFDGDRLTPADVESLSQLAADHDAVVVGPGLGDTPATTEAVRSLVAALDGPVVVDADAIAALPDDADAQLLATPHAGEFERLTGRAVDGDTTTRADAVRAAAAASPLDLTLLLTGPQDTISDGQECRIARTGSPAMTVGGTGDVLAGVAGALSARLDPLAAGGVAAYATGLAGERAATGHNGLVAGELLAELPAALTDDGGDRI